MHPFLCTLSETRFLLIATMLHYKYIGIVIMNKSTTHTTSLLRRFGLKATSTRAKVLEVLYESPTALSHGDITERLSGHNIDKVTLYRTLNTFAESGLVHKVATEDRNWHYAFFMHEDTDSASQGNHAHFVCNECERIYCLPMQTFDPTPQIKEKSGFIIKSREYRLHGLCPECY